MYAVNCERRSHCLDQEAPREEGYWAPNLDESCNAYGGCPFRRVCLSEPARQESWLLQDFTKRKWDPITRTETEL